MEISNTIYIPFICHNNSLKIGHLYLGYVLFNLGAGVRSGVALKVARLCLPLVLLSSGGLLLNFRFVHLSVGGVFYFNLAA
jgi:hypothetical protein